ncbi:MAG: proton-conducting membrane transporter [Lachnospiraceae bacterium]|nr:proton-conducting membrane transporter [Lachnospiraceae bacterium]
MLLACAMLFPALAGILIFVCFPDDPGMEEAARKKRTRARNDACAAAVLITDLLCALALASGGTLVPVTYSDQLRAVFSPDGFGSWVLIAALILYTAVCFYSFEYMEQEERPHVFFAFYFISFAAMISVCLAGNLVTLYFCFEMLTLTSMPLVLHEMTKEAVGAALKYLFYSVAGALLGLFALFFVYQFASGDASFVMGGFLDPGLYAGRTGLLYGAAMAGIIGFGTKAGLYPMHGWLPTAHPIAPAPASALLSGIIAKAGIVAVVRLVYYSIGAEVLRGTWVQTAWMTLAMLTIFMGSMMAFREKVLKKRLAYSTISQISYIMLALSFLSGGGLRGGLIHLMSHVMSKGCLFLAAGAFIAKLGIRRTEGLKGVGKRMSVTLWCFTIASLSLVGIPPMGGFLSKWVIASAAIGSGIPVYSVLAPVVLLISALLTAGYLLPVTVDGFFPGRGDDTAEEKAAGAPSGGHAPADTASSAEPSLRMILPMAVLCAGALAAGLFGIQAAGLFGF